MSRDTHSHGDSSPETQESSHHRSGEPDRTHAHEQLEHEHWDFLPRHPPLSDERPDSYPESASDEEAYQSYYESICGTRDESVPVESYDGAFDGITEDFVDEHEGPVGQLQWQEDLQDLEVVHESATRYAGERWCSGTLIDDDLLLTAGHCFMIQNMPRPADVARHMQVNFDYQRDSDGELRGAETHEIVELVEHEFRHDGLDYAVVRLAGTPGETYGTAKIAGRDAAEGDRLCLISHPNQMPKRVEAGHATHLHDVRIGYGDLDTADGSSGAGILKSPSGHLVGVHTMGGCDAVRSSHNHGIRIEPLLENSETLSRLATGDKAVTSPKQESTAQTTTVQQTGDAATTDAAEETQQSAEHTGGGGQAHPQALVTESHRSTFESHRSTLESHRSTLESHRSTLESQEAMVELHRTLFDVQEQILETNIESLSACLDALEECTDEIQQLTDENRTRKTGGQ